MANKARNTSGKFAPKSETPRKVRSVNLTDEAWQWLATVSEKAGMSRNDYLEALAERVNPLMETVETKPDFEFEIASPDEIEAALVTPDEAKKHAAIYGFSPDEALADAYFQVNMLTSNYDGLEDRYETLKREYSALLESLPLMETVQAETEALKQELRSQLVAVQAEREDLAQFKKEAKEAAAEVHREGVAIKGLEIQWQQRLTDARGELTHAKAIILKQNDKIRELKRGFSLQSKPSDVATMKAQRLEIGDLRAELADLKQKSAPIAIAVEFPEPATILSKLRAKRKKSKTDLADVEAILELLDNC